jgi:hypothetical protein
MYTLSEPVRAVPDGVGNGVRAFVSCTARRAFGLGFPDGRNAGPRSRIAIRNGGFRSPPLVKGYQLAATGIRQNGKLSVSTPRKLSRKSSISARLTNT